MIRIQRDGVEIALNYEEFIREVREGSITADTLVRSDVLTMGAWKPAGQLQFFRSWAPGASLPPDTGPDRPAATPEQTIGAGPDDPNAPGGPFIDATAWEAPDAPASLPWERIEELGFFRAFSGTVRLALTKADDFGRGVGAGEVVMPSLVFGLLVTAIAALFDALYQVAVLRIGGPMFEQMSSSIPGIFGPGGPPTARDILFQHGMGILFYPALIFVWGGIVHLLLRLFGKPARGFAATLRVANYSMAPQILTLLPVCGSIVAWVWTIVLLVRGIMIVQRTGGVGASAAVLLAPARILSLDDPGELADDAAGDFPTRGSVPRRRNPSCSTTGSLPERDSPPSSCGSWSESSGLSTDGRS